MNKFNDDTNIELEIGSIRNLDTHYNKLTHILSNFEKVHNQAKDQSCAFKTYVLLLVYLNIMREHIYKFNITLMITWHQQLR